MSKKRAYQAYGKGATVTRDTPRAAALAYFETQPNRRTCDVVGGESDGMFFTRVYGMRAGIIHEHWSDVTRKGAAELPDVASGEARPMDNSAVYHIDILDDDVRAACDKALPWHFETDLATERFATEDAACAAQRAHRRANGFDEITGK